MSSDEEIRVADALALRCVLVPCEHWTSCPRHVDPKVWKSYKVTLDGVEIGTVYRYREETYRMAGRLRTGIRHVLRWSGDAAKSFRVGYHVSRKRAVEEVCRGWVRANPGKKL